MIDLGQLECIFATTGSFLRFVEDAPMKREIYMK